MQKILIQTCRYRIRCILLAGSDLFRSTWNLAQVPFMHSQAYLRLQNLFWVKHAEDTYSDMSLPHQVHPAGRF